MIKFIVVIGRKYFSNKVAQSNYSIIQTKLLNTKLLKTNLFKNINKSKTKQQQKQQQQTENGIWKVC